MTYETRSLPEIEFPVYFSLLSTPGYNASQLNSLGIKGEFSLFLGTHRFRNGSTLREIEFGSGDNNIAGSETNITELCLMWFIDIWNKSRIDLREYLVERKVFFSKKGDEDRRGDESNLIVSIKTRPSYPADRLTLALSQDRTREKIIRSLSLRFKQRPYFDVGLVLEDKKRSVMNYFYENWQTKGFNFCSCSL